MGEAKYGAGPASLVTGLFCCLRLAKAMKFGPVFEAGNTPG